ncbi:beta-N-acetylhexosaminidase [Eilatimonas milleporae]|uniref:beta-N-acetylhexosaminidase n=1 Tax=Eilatimonas milleporae TaxID=911205 RepID=A0A3M0CP06_9PROT|nr:beta-N-acetylhexosaminidase [Eilatimonas milleporae]RMB05013.1 beta-N-acetylhexosaminidase [Eilatimonas milleporae]
MIPVLFGLAGPELLFEERRLFQDCVPAGFILFKRNVENPAQLRRLTDSLRHMTGREHLPILIDQEGGRVQRMGPPRWRAYPAMGVFGHMARQDPAKAAGAASALRLHTRLIADDLRRVGITVNCLPLIDVPQPDADGVIGDRAFDDDPSRVAALGRIVADALTAGGVLPVIKHIPGHGRAMVDSHEALPRVEAALETLEKIDFPPFRALRDAPFAMTAHVVYTALDAAVPATLSRVVIRDWIRGHMGYRGLLMSDDIGMNALSGTMADRARGCIAAGCDLVLHCDGDLDAMRSIADALPQAEPILNTRLSCLVGGLSEAGDGLSHSDRLDLEQRYDHLMKDLLPA